MKIFACLYPFLPLTNFFVPFLFLFPFFFPTAYRICLVSPRTPCIYLHKRTQLFFLYFFSYFWSFFGLSHLSFFETPPQTPGQSSTFVSLKTDYVLFIKVGVVRGVTDLLSLPFLLFSFFSISSTCYCTWKGDNEAKVSYQIAYHARSHSLCQLTTPLA